MRLILASGSPRRRELLATIVREFEVVPSEIDETLEAGPTSEAVARLAARKARAVAGRMGEGIVLGADTVVVLDGQVLGKPGGAGEAGAMLRRLRGREHEVITGIAAVDAGRGREASRAVVTRRAGMGRKFSPSPPAGESPGARPARNGGGEGSWLFLPLRCKP